MYLSKVNSEGKFGIWNFASRNNDEVKLFWWKVLTILATADSCGPGYVVVLGWAKMWLCNLLAFDLVLR